MEEDKEKALKDMAELLLSKATMLQYHCAKCKSPLFEKDILCPVCGVFEEEKDKEEKKAGEEARSKTKDALKKKRDELLKKLEKEKDPEKVVALVEAIEKINNILNP
jgi:UPF0148 protein